MARISRATRWLRPERRRKQDGLKIYTVGVGTAAGDLIPLPPDRAADSSRTIAAHSSNRGSTSLR